MENLKLITEGLEDLNMNLFTLSQIEDMNEPTKTRSHNVDGESKDSC